MMTALYSVALGLFVLGYLPIFAVRRMRTNRDGRDLAHRWGWLGDGLPAEPRCWIHAVSVGEVAAAVPLVQAIRRRWPTFSIVLSTVTPTGARVVGRELADVATHRYFPLDLPGPVRRAVDAVRPSFFIGLETELWPNFLGALHARGIPTMIANGRISDRSFRRYRMARPFVARMLRRVSVFAMQSEEDARRIIDLGAPAERVVVTGNLKADLRADASDTGDGWERLLGLGRGCSLWVAGSTHRGEEVPVLDAFDLLRPRFPQLRLLVAPRHPERTQEVERLIRERGWRAQRRTVLDGTTDDEAVIILDTVGELATLYRWADVVFIGGSLVPIGGHNMLEPAQRRKPVLFGPHTENFRESAELLLNAGAAVVVNDAAELAREVERMLVNPERSKAMGNAAFRAVAARQGALHETLALVERHLIARDAIAR
ncbi:MAG: 3-deoxy-D-manno-octulosonic acid transferase [Candidatus Rokuibacteriota bacterium]|nr:MAG: 3-deoxy-D-manno-octulosonic acid transferase [Candidatus Rokubacteria bacterium]